MAHVKNLYRILAESILSGLREVEENPFGAPPQVSGTQPIEGGEEMDETPKSPEEEVMELAQEMSVHTRDVPSILRGIKGIIQTKYANPAQASGLVGMLQQTNDETLKAVAVQLDRYLRAI